MKGMFKVMFMFILGGTHQSSPCGGAAHSGASCPSTCHCCPSTSCHGPARQCTTLDPSVFGIRVTQANQQVDAGKDCCRDLVANHQVRNGRGELYSFPCQLVEEFLTEKYILGLLQFLLPWCLPSHKVTAGELCRTNVLLICLNMEPADRYERSPIMLFPTFLRRQFCRRRSSSM